MIVIETAGDCMDRIGYIRSLHFLQLTKPDLVELALDDRRMAEKIRDHFPERFGDVDFGDIPYRAKPDVESIMLKYDMPDPKHKVSRAQKKKHKEYYEKHYKHVMKEKYHAKKNIFQK